MTIINHKNDLIIQSNSMFKMISAYLKSGWEITLEITNGVMIKNSDGNRIFLHY